MERVLGDGGRAALSGQVSSISFGRETWVGDRHFGYLKRGDAVVPGRWHAAGAGWEFVLDDPRSLKALEGASELEVLDGYWGEKAELVLDCGIEWSPARWEAAEDHDHCAICWATIRVNGNRDHLVATNGRRACPACAAYVLARSLDFIRAHAGGHEAAR